MPCLKPARRVRYPKSVQQFTVAAKRWICTRQILVFKTEQTEERRKEVVARHHDMYTRRAMMFHIRQ